MFFVGCQTFMVELVAPNVFFLKGWAALDNISSNCFFLKNDAEGANGELLLIDCGNSSEQTARQLREAIGELKGVVKAVYCTHGHYDHVGGVKALAASNALPASVPVFLSEKDFYLIPESERKRFTRLEEKEVKFGSFVLTVVETPGHSPGGVCFWEARKKILFSGDTLFAAGAFGRTDFEGGDMRAIERSLASIKKLGWGLLCPGHDDLQRA